jgi:hypothetical protein
MAVFRVMIGDVTTNVSRDQVLWYRVRQHGLLRDSEEPAVLDIGLQDTQAGSAQLALAARTTGPVSLDRYELAWTLRGAPHHHRPGELRRLAGELWPWSDADAQARLMWPKSRTVTGGLTAMETYRLVAASMRKVVTKPMTKGAASTEVTKLVPAEQTRACPGCKSTHIYEQPFRLGALPAGLRLRAGETGLLLEPLPKRGPIPTKSTNPHGLVHRYLRFLGPATPAEVAKWLDTSTTNVREIWPDDLAEVFVDGRRAWLPKENVDELLDCDRVELVRLLPAMDPFLQARDRDLLVPDKAEQKALWTILGNPGALLVDGQIGGMWRSRLVGRKKLEVTVTSFDLDVDPSTRDGVQAEAERIADVRGVPTAVVRYA